MASSLDFPQIIKLVYDEALNRLRVDAEISAIIAGDIDVSFDAFTSPFDNAMAVGSEDGTKTGTKHVHRVDSDLDLRVGISNGSNKAAVSVSGQLSTKDAGLPLTIGQLVAAASTSVVLASDHPVIAISAASLPLPTGAATSANQTSSIALLTTIDTSASAINSKLNTLGQKAMTGSVPVVLASDQSPIPITLTDEPIKISGTENGQPGGTEFTFVNNLRQQILAAKDRLQNITYADFGTKDQRVTQIDYTAASIGSGAGYTARKTFTYTLVGTKYRRDSINWSLV